MCCPLNLRMCGFRKGFLLPSCRSYLIKFEKFLSIHCRPHNKRKVSRPGREYPFSQLSVNLLFFQRHICSPSQRKQNRVPSLKCISQNMFLQRPDPYFNDFQYDHYWQPSKDEELKDKKTCGNTIQGPNQAPASTRGYSLLGF